MQDVQYAKYPKNFWGINKEIDFKTLENSRFSNLYS
ncbi:hypothetical protein Thicy_1210 [Thiomicrospira cyclica ALM1]|uniref:Uncharacterized protein n=1 Tax=Thiomicrospira cyclica (strain DSM 14477 / JCM 11371 / ALM1) TaxID=717773 RepID=F6D8X7_THICA|nr:hypothetical protein Thicy_1210 [Thiomicrospira cyclica ALM1]